MSLIITNHSCQFICQSFLVISDPVQAKHVLRDANTMYDKGLLSEILKPIMGKGLIPADPETWSVRRRAIVPAFHRAWLNHMVGLFGYCNENFIVNLEKAAAKNDAPAGQSGGKIEMEEKFCSVALDIIGLSVFNYEFGSVSNESPVIKVSMSSTIINVSGKGIDLTTMLVFFSLEKGCLFRACPR